MARDRIIPRDLHLFSSAQLRPLEDAIPASWPGAWGDLARIFFIGMLNVPELKATPAAMVQTALEQTRVTARQMGGRNNYIPMALVVEMAERDEGIKAAFTGDNISHLAARHNLTDTRIRQILGLDKGAKGKRLHR